MTSKDLESIIKKPLKMLIGYVSWIRIKRQLEKVNYREIKGIEDLQESIKDFVINTSYKNKNIESFVKGLLKPTFEVVNRSNTMDSLILICIEKNDRERLEQLFIHYKSIGVRKFVVVDNNSDDGTFEWLKCFSDIDLYIQKEAYTTQNREIWINQILRMYGYDKWYLVVDSDEFITYKGMENHSIYEIIQKCEQMGINCVRGIMLDMYPDIREKVDNGDFRSKMKYFDGSGYKKEDNSFFYIIRGGMRERVLETRSILTKYPLFYFKKGIIEESSHYRYPYKQNFDAPCFFGILHYKFINDKDFKNIKERVKNGNYSNGSEQYKGYLKAFSEGKTIDFMYKDSCEFTNSYSLDCIDEIINCFGHN